MSTHEGKPRPTQHDKAEFFSRLHRKGSCFVIPNPWDAGSARLLEHLGFQALASTGAGYAFSRGRSDLSLGAEDMLSHLAALAEATDLPVSADLQKGFGDAPDDAARTIAEAARTGIVGGSIEDASGDPQRPVYDIGLAAERIRAAADAARSLRFKFTLTARAENFLYGRPDLADTIRRLQAYQEAGADVLFAPGLQTKEEIRAVVQSVDRPVNVIMGLPGVPLTLPELEQLGVARVSVGASLARAAYGAMMRAAREILQSGSFAYVAEAVPGREINTIFAKRPG
ncbi:MAG: isocitrate lyase/phosphoenolpyruvate mutase family protein [Aquabacterium sp.]|nr:MAG: isocitrate lyase/phosphoenolpyruvate mutase family protein [Aquabacterium sp.]